MQGFLRKSIINFIYILAWVLVIYVLWLISAEGNLSIFEDAYGSWLVYGAFAYILLSMTGCLFLRIFIKREWII